MRTFADPSALKVFWSVQSCPHQGLRPMSALVNTSLIIPASNAARGSITSRSAALETTSFAAKSPPSVLKERISFPAGSTTRTRRASRTTRTSLHAQAGNFTTSADDAMARPAARQAAREGERRRIGVFRTGQFVKPRTSRIV